MPIGSEPKPFPREWLKRYTVEELERLAIMTVDGGMTDEEALIELERRKKDENISSERSNIGGGEIY